MSLFSKLLLFFLFNLINSLLFPLYEGDERCLIDEFYEDSYFAFQIYMSGEPIAVAEKGSYYYWEGPSYSRKTIENPTDEAIPFFKAFEKMIREHGFEKEQEDKWLDVYRKHRSFALQNYYEGINNDKGRKIWRERVAEAYPDAGIDFDKVDEEIAQKEKEEKEKSKKRILY